VSGNVITQVETGQCDFPDAPDPCWEDTIIANFAFSDDRASISGDVFESDPEEECQGIRSGSLERIDEPDEPDDGADDGADDGTDDGTDDGADDANSRFYGTYDFEVTGECGPESGTIEIGSDLEQRGEDFYIWIPASGFFETYQFEEGGEVTTTDVIVTFNSISQETEESFEGDLIWEQELDFDFASDFNSATITGEDFDPDPQECSGTFSGTMTRVDGDGDGDGGGGGGGGSSTCFISTIAHSLGW
jgi:hypothetical protein